MVLARDRREERVSDIKRIAMITLSNAAHMQMPLLRARGRRKGGREEANQARKLTRSLLVFAHSASLLLRYITRETSAKSVIYRRALHASGEETDADGQTDGRGRTMREREQRYIWRRRWPRRKWKTEETGSKEGERERGEGEGRSAGLSFLSAGIAYMTRPSGGGRRGWQRGSRWSGGL